MLVFWLFSFAALAQQSTDIYSGMVIKQLSPEGGILLDKGWKFHAGDNSEWANPSFNDSGWQPISLTKQLMDLPELRAAGIGWLRLKLHIGEALRGKEINLIVRQDLASEIYLNDRLLARYGKVSANSSEEETYDPKNQPLPIHFSSDSVQVLAVRYSFHEHSFYYGKFDIAFAATLRSNNRAWSNVLDKVLGSINAAFTAGVFLLIGLLHLFLYLSYRTGKVNLYFLVFAFLTGLGNIPGAFSLFTHRAATGFVLVGLVLLISRLAICFYLLALYELFKIKKGWWLTLLIAVQVLSLPVSFPLGNSAMAALLFVINIAVYIETVRITIVALQNKLPNATAFLIGQLVTLSSLSLLMIFWFVPQLHVSHDSLLFMVTADLTLFSPAVCISFILAREFAQINRSLQQQLVQVNELSEKTIQQEQEKQQILSSQKERLESEVAQRTRELNHSLQELKATQRQLIHQEKMASLGELTAGIAHEIQNPLNFVNNFSETNKELLSEMKQAIKQRDYEEAEAIASDLEKNEEKISHHGRRADSIVKGMLQHSRQSTGKKEPTDINKLADEYLRLSYQGMRAKDKSFSATVETHFEEGLGTVNAVPQDIGRVLLNLYNNAFYAVNEKKKALNGIFEPRVSVSTKKDGNTVRIVVKDNGTGMSQSVMNKVFQPFFTTKPTGEGTGLGLSLSYDIITKGHGGNLSVQSQEGEGAEFVVELRNTSPT